MGWASEEFDTIDLGDARLNKRAVKLAEAFAQSPTASIPGACHDRAELRAAYRFFDHEDVGFWDVLEPHMRCTERRMAAHPVALCLQDTSSLDFNGRDIEGLGPLNYEPQRGLHVHPTYAVTPGREPLGILDCWHWARKFRDDGGERPADVVESQRWVDGYERIAELAATMPDTRLVHVGDRESDMSALMKRAAALGHPADWLVRAKTDRVLGGEQADGAKLFATVTATTSVGEVRFVYRPRRGKKAREVVQKIHVKRVALGKRDKLDATCVIARELDPPAGEEPIEWRLLTNREITTVEEAAELIDWYRARWEVEMFFDVLKNGCQVEELQLHTLERLEVALALFMIVAWRINRLMRLGRECPEMEAGVIFEPEEIIAAYAINKQKVPDAPASLGQVMRLVAMAGGFIGRKSDGDPGVRTIWRGMEKVMSFADGIRWSRAHAESG